MKKQGQNKRFIIYLSLLLILLSGGNLLGEELTLEEAIKFGLENNSGLRANYEELQRQERNLKEPDQLKWQVDLGANYRHNFANVSGQNLKEGSSNDYSLNISADKYFLSGLKLSPGVNIMEDLDPSFNINISKPLYPLVPTELARSYYKSQQELLKARRTYARNRINAILSWIDSYLNLERMNSRQDIYQENLLKAEANLEKVLAREGIGDAGENDILTASLGLENARYSLLEAENNLENLHFTFLNELGLAPEKEIIIKDSTEFLVNLRREVEIQVEELLAQDSSALMDIVERNNARLEANLVDREILKNELNWLEKEGGLNLGLSSNYNSVDDNLSVGLSLSYALYDGGQHKQAIEDKEKALTDNLRSYEEIYIQLQQELKKHLDKLELANMALRRGELSLARSENELEVAEKQLAMGLIDYLAYQEKWIAAAEARITIKTLEDELFMSRLEFLNFLDQELLSELIGGMEK